MTIETKSDAVMRRALELARAASAAGEVPVAAIITNLQGEIVAEAANAMASLKKATAHAEMQAIELAMQQTGTSCLTDYDIWVTLEPCAMCAGAISAMPGCAACILAPMIPKAGRWNMARACFIRKRPIISQRLLAASGNGTARIY